MSKFRKRLRLILWCCIIFGGLLIAAILSSVFGKGSFDGFELFTRSETVYIILIFALSLPILLWALLIEVKRRNEKEEYLPAYLCELAGAVLDDSQCADGEKLVQIGENVSTGDEERLGEYKRKLPSNGTEAATDNTLPDKALHMMYAYAPSSEDEERKAEDKRAPRFCMLSETDERMSSRTAAHYTEESDLRVICEKFRLFCASRMGLYYDIEDIIRFIAGLSVTKLVIMQGMSGTGKTSLSYAFGEFLRNPSVIVPIQPMWKERSDLIGYFNEFTGRFNETTLLQKMYEAGYSEDVYVTVLDEMNIARVEYYFAEFLSLLELPDPDKRYLDVVSDKWESDPVMLKDGKIRLPENMWFMGTVNNDDSTFAISDKVYDRAMVMNLDKKCEPFECEDQAPRRISAKQLEGMMSEARAEYAISDRNMRRIRKLDKYLIGKFRITFGNRIMKQLSGYVPVYIACGGDEIAAIDDILSKKVFRKLDSQNPVYVKSVAEDVCEYLDSLFGKDALPLCKEYVRRPR